MILKKSEETEEFVMSPKLKAWSDVGKEIKEPEDKQFTAVLGNYIKAGLTCQQKANEVKAEEGKSSPKERQDVFDEFKSAGVAINELEGAEDSASDGFLADRVAYHMLKSRGLVKSASSSRYLMSIDYQPDQSEINDAVVNSYIDCRAILALKSVKNNCSVNDFNMARTLLAHIHNDKNAMKIVKNSMYRVCHKDPVFIKNAGWGILGDIGGAIGNAFESAYDATTDFVQWTGGKAVEFGSRMIGDIAEHGKEFLVGIGSALKDWVVNNPAVLLVIGAVSWFMREVVLKVIPIFGIIYGLIMAFKNVWYAWKSIKALANEANAGEFGLDTTISPSGDLFNPSKGLKLPIKLDEILTDITRDFNDREIASTESLDDYEERRTGDPEKLSRFVRVVKLSKVFVTEMLGLPFNIIMVVFDSLTLGIKWGSLVAGPFAPVVAFLGFLLEAAVNVVIMFAEHYVLTAKKKEFDKVLKRIQSISDENFGRLVELDASGDVEAWEYLREQMKEIEELEAKGPTAKNILDQKRKEVQDLLKDLSGGDSDLSELTEG